MFIKMNMQQLYDPTMRRSLLLRKARSGNCMNSKHLRPIQKGSVYVQDVKRILVTLTVQHQASSAEGDEVFWVGLVIMEDHKHGRLLLVVHQTVEAVGGV